MGTPTSQPFVPYTNMKIETKNTPNSLCYALQGLTDAQNSAIRDMGFESIKSFSIHKIPAGLGYWLLVNYDHKRNKLNVGNRIIKITPSKVHEVLGVPMGKIAVSEKRKTRKEDAIRKEWRKQSFPHKVLVKHVTEKLKSYTGGGTLFKLNFLVVFNSIMGETTKSSTINQKFLASINNLGDIPNMDWCSYIITCLKRSKEGWDGKEPYNGPLIFLAVLYAHEQQLKCSPEKAITPAIKYVTTDYLVDLESSMCDNGPCLNDDDEEDDESTQYVEVQVQLETHVKSAGGQTDEVQAAVDQNVNIPIGPPGAQSLSGLSANLGHCNRHEPSKDVQLLDDDDDDDDVVIILDLKKEQCELVENFSSRRSGTVCVQGYTVRRDVAEILEAIFKKHGDIAAECLFKTDSMRSTILEAVCEVAKQIQANNVIDKLAEIENRVSDAKAVNIDVSWLQAHLEAIRNRQEAHEEYRLLIEAKEKANILLAKTAAQINLRKRRAELAAAQERSKKAKRCVGVLHLVAESLMDNLIESKAKKDSLVNDPVV